MERKLEDLSGENEKTKADNFEKQIKETFILKNVDLDYPQLNFEYLNEEILISDFTFIQNENYNPQLSFDQLKIINNKIQLCDYEQKKLQEVSLTPVIDQEPKLQKCSFYLAEEITIITNIYMFLIDKLRQLLPDHIILNNLDYTKEKYLKLMLYKDFPNMDYLIEYLQIQDSKTIKKLIRDIPQEVSDYKKFFDEVKNFSGLRDILKNLNLTEARKLTIYFSNLIKYIQYIVNYYNKNLHNKDGKDGNFYIKNIPKLIEVDEEFSSDEQKIFLQESKNSILKQNEIDQQNSSEEDDQKYHIKDEQLQELLQEYDQQCQEKEQKEKTLKEQNENFEKNLKESQELNKNTQKPDKEVTINDFYVFKDDQKYLTDSNMDLLYQLPIDGVTLQEDKNQNESTRLSKSEKKKLKKEKRKQQKQEKAQQRLQKQKEQIQSNEQKETQNETSKTQQQINNQDNIKQEQELSKDQILQLN